MARRGSPWVGWSWLAMGSLGSLWVDWICWVGWVGFDGGCLWLGSEFGYESQWVWV